MLEPAVDLDEMLRGRGLRVTAPRRAVLDFLCRSSDHPTAEEVGRAVNRRSPRASRASVYNVLRSLKAAGLVREFAFEGAIARYDANLDPHDHFVCRACGCVEDLPLAGPRPAPRPDAYPGAAFEEATVTFRGVCPTCLATPPGRPGRFPRE